MKFPRVSRSENLTRMINIQADFFHGGSILTIWSNYFRDLTRVLGPQKVAVWKGNGTPYFRKIQGWWNIIIWPEPWVDCCFFEPPGSLITYAALITACGKCDQWRQVNRPNVGESCWWKRRPLCTKLYSKWRSNASNLWKSNKKHSFYWWIPFF